MKKTSKSIVKVYSKLNDSGTTLEYYGVLMKNGRARIDTKRYKKFFELPNSKIERRKTVYYIPSKIHRYEYMCNRFFDNLLSLKNLWINEFSKAIMAIKTPKQAEDDSRTANLMDGVLDYDKACMVGKMAGLKRDGEYRFVIKSIYAQFFQQMMSQVDALCLRIAAENGYQERKFSKEQFDVFIQGKQKNDVKSFRDYEFYSIYDKAYRTWNFLKHNSIKGYDQLKTKYPEMIYDPGNKYQNGDAAISVLKIDERFILKTLDDLHLFFDELCKKAFDENADDAKWDYDDYFIQQAKDEIETIENPLGIPWFL